MNVSKTIADETVNGNFTSDVIDMSLVSKFSIQAIFPSSLTGTFTLEASSENSANPSSWGTIPNSSQAVASDGSVLWNNSSSIYKFVRVKFAHSAGSSNLQVHVVLKD